ncbi:hypothetical protein KC717_04370 [Candidatus Dojkabacteria bacterium]|uniref:Uncharacterized protein n=1 Tax=Candidatus Dojkabacteria bacterium TaxID=2099670 RepID=A0A955RKW1_9BACT|nr:hypothetical protein [Candidatus Dojkabacteria bacterium]
MPDFGIILQPVFEILQFTEEFEREVIIRFEHIVAIRVTNRLLHEYFDDEDSVNFIITTETLLKDNNYKELEEFLVSNLPLATFDEYILEETTRLLCEYIAYLKLDKALNKERLTHIEQQLLSY